MDTYLFSRIIKSFIKIFIPNNFTNSFSKSGQSTGRYCYSIWLRHLVKASENGFNAQPLHLAEFGPGNNLGVGITALLSGSETYVGFDAQPSISIKNNLRIFNEVLDLLSKKADIPDENEFPNVKPFLKNYKFPNYILDDERLEISLNKNRVNKIRQAITTTYDPNSIIQYCTDNSSQNLIRKFDLIFSQAVMEHVEELEETYKFMSSILRDNGFMSHQIDFKSHLTAKTWDGHWRYSNLIWKMIKGNQNWLINRMPFTKHLEFLEQNNFKNIKVNRNFDNPTFSRDKLATKFFLISDIDRRTSGGFIQAGK